MQIIKFKNGKYGIRKRNLLDKILKGEGVFRDFKPQIYKWRTTDCHYFKDCQLDSFEEVVEIFNNLNFGVIEKVIV